MSIVVMVCVSSMRVLGVVVVDVGLSRFRLMWWECLRVEVVLDLFGELRIWKMMWNVF